MLDDLSSLRKDQAETSVLFGLISKRYERRSLLITANHHSTMIEMNVESYRQRAATTRKRRHDRKTTAASDTITLPNPDWRSTPLASGNLARQSSTQVHPTHHPDCR